MPIYEVERDGKVYEVDAPDPQLAAAAVDPTKITAFVDKRNAEAKVKPYEAGPLETLGRSTAQTLTGLARGVVGLPAMVEEGVEGAVNLMGKARGREMPGLPRILRAPVDFLSPPELAPRDPTEQAVATGSEFLGGAVTGVGAGRELAERAVNPVTKAVGQTLADNPGRQLIGAGTGAAAVEATRAAGGGPVAQTIAGVVGTGAPMVGARPTGQVPIRNPRPFGAATEKARAMGFRILPSQAAAQRQMAAPPGTFPGRHGVPGGFRETMKDPTLIQQFIIDNQKRVNDFAAKELGISEITEQGLALAKNPHNAVYNEVAQVLPVLKFDDALKKAIDDIGAVRRNNEALKSTPQVEELRLRLLNIEQMPTQDALTAMRELRKEARRYFQQADKDGGPAAEQAAEAYRAASDAIEGAIEAQTATLFPDLAPRFREARTALAKIHNVEDALDGTFVDPQKLAKLGEKYPLTGYLADLAEVARDFPETIQNARGAALHPASNVSMVHWLSLPVRRAAGAMGAQSLTDDAFQNRLGVQNPNYQPSRPTPAAPARPSPLAAPPPTPAAGPGTVNFEPTPNVMPPSPVLGRETDQLGAIGLADDFDTLSPAEALPGDLTAEVPPAPAGVPFAQQDVGVAEALARDLGLEVPPERPAGSIDFELDPTLDPVSIVRNGPAPGTVQDALLSEELMGRPGENLSRPLDFETGSTLAPLDEEMVTRPAPGLGEDLTTDFGAPPRDPLLEDMEARGREGDFEPGVGPQPRPGYDPYADATDAEIVGTRRPDAGAARPLPPPDDLAGELVEPQGPAPRGGAGGDDLALADDLPPPDDVRARYPQRPIPPGADVIEPATRDGYIAFRKRDDGTWRIGSAFVEEESRGKGVMQRLMLRLMRDAKKENAVLNSDSSVSEDQLRVYRALRDKGLAKFDGDLDAAFAALDEFGKADNPSGEPWFKNIRPAE